MLQGRIEQAKECQLFKVILTGSCPLGAPIDTEELARMERVVLQAIAYKEGKPFEVKTPLNVSRKIDLTKFFKAHCFRPGVYFETPVIEIPLYSEPVSKKVSKR